MVTKNDLKIKASLLHAGVDFSGKHVLEQLYDENKVFLGTGLYNYNRAKLKGKEISVQNNKNIRAPNEIHWDFLGSEMKAEVRANPNSPYKISVNGSSYQLFNKKTGELFGEVTFPDQSEFFMKKTKYGTPVSKVISRMGESALRVYPDMTCVMDKPSIKCRFCGTLPERRNLTDEQITEEIVNSISLAQREMPVDYIFMSTGAFYDNKQSEFYRNVISGIKETLTNKNAEILFAFSPPTEKKFTQLERILTSGLTDASYNMEAWDENLWDINNKFNIGHYKVQKGKEDLIKAYKRSVEILGKGSVKSNFIGGLESIDSLKEGVGRLLDIGVIPSMTVYYSTPGSEWSVNGYNPCVKEFVRDPSEFLVNAYVELAKATDDAGFGFTWSRKNRISGMEHDALAYIKNDNNLLSKTEKRMLK